MSGGIAAIEKDAAPFDRDVGLAWIYEPETHEITRTPGDWGVEIGDDSEGAVLRSVDTFFGGSKFVVISSHKRHALAVECRVRQELKRPLAARDRGSRVRLVSVIVGDYDRAKCLSTPD